jgi:hypothetical protein
MPLRRSFPAGARFSIRLSHMDEDVVLGTFAKEDIEREIERILERHYILGYREGLFLGKSETLQEALDVGFYCGALRTLEKVFDPEESCVGPESVDETVTTRISVERIKEKHASFKSLLERNIMERTG